MVRSPLIVIGHALTVDVVEVVQKINGGQNTKTMALIAGTPFPFPHFRAFLPPPFTFPFAPAKQGTKSTNFLPLENLSIVV